MRPTRQMRIGLAALIAGYGLSQFFRAFITVLAPVLQAEVGAGPGDLAVASGLWFLSFALIQLPIGWALDRIGPGLTAGGLLGLCGGAGALVFARAHEPLHLDAAMILLGAGCAPVLMAAYYLLARCWPPAAFSAMAGLTVGIGSLGDVLGAAPLVRLTEAFGWRPTLAAVAALTFAVGAAVALLVPRPAAPPVEAGARANGSLRELLTLRGLRVLLPLVFVSYAAMAAVRGLWAGPLLVTLHGGDARMIGRATLLMGLSNIAANLVVGRLVALAGGPRPVVLVLSGAACAGLAVLGLAPGAGVAAAYAAFAALGMSGAVYALLMAQGRTVMPPRLIGLGIPFMNMFSLAGVGMMQFGSRQLYRWTAVRAGEPAAIAAVFAFFLLPLLAGLALYALAAREGRDA